MESTGIKDKNGIIIMLGHQVKHGNNVFLVQKDSPEKDMYLRVLNDTGMNWRDLKWLANVSKYCEVIENDAT